MLGGSLTACLSTAKEERHAFQVRIVEMIGEVLKGSEEGHQAILREADEKFSKAQADKASCEGELERCVTAVAEKTQAEEAADAAFKESTTAFNAAKAALSQAQEEQKVGDADLETAATRKSTLESAKADKYEALKEGTAASTNANVQALIKVGKDFSFDSSLLNALPSAISKAPGDRTSFDGMVLTQAETEFRRCLDALEETLTNGESGKKERAEKVASAEAALSNATDAEQACQAALSAAKVEKKEAEAARKAASKALHALGPELKKAGAELQRASATLDDFRAGPLMAYKELAERSAAVADSAPAEGVAEGETAPAE